MNIALYHNLPSGGARRAMVEMTKLLVARGHIVDEYCPETADLSFLPLDSHLRRTVVLPFHPLGIATTRVPFLTPYITAARLAYDLRVMAAVGQQAAQRIGREEYDIVFTHDCQLVLVPDVLRFLQQPSVHYFHIGSRGFATKQNPSHSRTGLLEKLKGAYYAPASGTIPWLRNNQAQRNLRAARRVLTNSNFARSELQEVFGITSQVCYLGVDVKQFRPLGLPRETFVLSVGAVHYHKGYRFLIQALAKLPQKQRPPLVIAANSAEPAEMQVLEALATQLRVHLTVCNVSDEVEMAILYNRAAAFVYCPIREPWGLAAVEAMACGTPIIAVSEGGVAESLVDGEANLITNRDSEAFAATLGRVLSDRSLAERLGMGGMARAQAHFTWESTVDRLETHFQEVVKVGAQL